MTAGRHCPNCGPRRTARIAALRLWRRLTRQEPMTWFQERFIGHEDAVAAHLRAKYPEVYGKGRP